MARAGRLPTLVLCLLAAQAAGGRLDSQAEESRRAPAPQQFSPASAEPPVPGARNIAPHSIPGASPPELPPRPPLPAPLPETALPPALNITPKPPLAWRVKVLKQQAAQITPDSKAVHEPTVVQVAASRPRSEPASTATFSASYDDTLTAVLFACPDAGWVPTQLDSGSGMLAARLAARAGATPLLTIKVKELKPSRTKVELALNGPATIGARTAVNQLIGQIGRCLDRKGEVICPR